MTSSAEVLRAVCGLALAASPGAGLDTRLALRIADIWRVPVSHVALAWPDSVAREALDDRSAFRLQGRGRDGWWVVLARARDGRSSAVRLRAGVRLGVWVAARPLSPGSVLQDGDARLESRLMWGEPPTHEVLTPELGSAVRCAISAGEALRAPALLPPALVRAGDAVRVSWSRPGVVIERSGIALADAGRGEKVRVRVDHSTLMGTVSGRGEVAIAKEDS
ncbi:MAG: flagellar basal body P-ring formation protein FlgA [Candidatus Eisenbacteria bacterium]|uniref:Flagella basal body P-ring formation protein FlgA n=1 Tax=Eiseniibacteriota bacterium TaxID=2212470 RepID=A0A849SC95_UNCEI|nr:flagellar basal body P-ring formation protein FlgA [Candidatus Eisenbacteria bacterium]